MLEILVGSAAGAAVVGLGGGLYEFSVVDPYWPKRVELIQPEKGGISRRRFWIPAHVVFEILLMLSLFLTWSLQDVRAPLLVAFASHATMRIWSAFDFIPKALRFERAEASETTAANALAWTKRSRFRFPLDLVTCISVMIAFHALAQH